MPTAIKIPTVFSAVDKFTSVVNGMTRNVKKFTDSGVSYVQRLDQKITGAFSRLDNWAQMGIGVGLAGVFAIAGRANLKYEDSLASVSAITGAVGKDLAELEKKSMATAKATYKSGSQILKAYELIGSARPELLQNVDALDAVTRSAITLSKAGKMDLATAATALTDVMNQFNIEASKSGKIIDMLAAGSIHGSAEINNIKESVLKFGATAKLSNVSLKESIALVEVLASKGVKGAEAGTKLRNLLTKMAVVKSLPDKAIKQLEKFGVNANLVSDSTVPLLDRLRELSKISHDVTAATAVFGEENKDAALNILQNISLYENLIGKLGETGNAYDMAAKNSSTMAFWIEAIKNRFTDALTATQTNNSALNATKDVMKFVADNMETILGVGVKLVGLYVMMKAVTWGVQAYTWLHSVAIGVNTALQKKSLFALRANTVALKAYAAAQWLVNIATSANPIGLIVIAILALIGVVAVIISYYNEWGAAMTLLLGPLGFIINLIQSFRRHWDSIVDAFKQDGILGGLKRIGAVILDALLMPMQQFLGLISKIPGVGKMVAPAMKFIEDMRANLNLDMAEKKEPEKSKNELANSGFIPSSQQQHNYTQETITEKFGKGQLDITVNDRNRIIEGMQLNTSDFFPNMSATMGNR